MQREGEAGAGDQPGGVLPGDGEPAISAIDSLIGAMPGRGLAAADRDGASPRESQVSVADMAVVHGVAGVVPGAGSWMSPVSGADSDDPELGEGGQAVWRRVAFQLRAWAWSQPARPARFKRFLYRQRRRAMVMEVVMVAGRLGGAQRRQNVS